MLFFERLARFSAKFVTQPFCIVCYIVIQRVQLLERIKESKLTLLMLHSHTKILFVRRIKQSKKNYLQN